MKTFLGWLSDEFSIAISRYCDSLIISSKLLPTDKFTAIKANQQFYSFDQIEYSSWWNKWFPVEIFNSVRESVIVERLFILRYWCERYGKEMDTHYCTKCTSEKSENHRCTRTKIKVAIALESPYKFCRKQKQTIVSLMKTRTFTAK